MRMFLRQIIFVVLIIVLNAGGAFAAAFDENAPQPGLRQSGYSAAALSQDEALIKKLEEIVLQPEQQENAAAKKPAVVLKGESGDGLIKLKWILMSKADDQSLRFSIRFGTESEKYTRTLAVGSGNEYVLRELRNFQPYYIQVVALDREQRMLFKSAELRITPLPLEVLGSRIEKAFSKTSPTMLETVEPERMRRELKQFGYDFFRNSLQLTSAIDAMPVGANYMLGPGDVVSLTAWGAVNLRQELTVDRNGELMIPKVGPVRVWGLPFDKAITAVSEAMNRYFRNYEINLTLSKLRTIQVYVVGEVEAPGNYSVSSLATVINALAAAGGPAHNGSLRGVRVTRGSKTVATVDLYDMLLSGGRNEDVQLQNGDTIFVPVIGPVVAVAGEVRRPAIYELNGRTTIPEMLKMAGGVSASGSLGRIQVERLENNRSRIVLDFVPKTGALEVELGGVELKDSDMLKVFPVQAALRQVVVLKGNVQQTGEYQFHPGMRLTDLLPSTQNLLPESYLESAEITRISPPDYRRELMTVNLRRALAGNQTDNLLLQEQDTVRIFSRWEMEERPKVAINGSVVNPGTYDYYPGMSVRDLVTAAGSAKRNAFLDQAELSRIVVAGDKAQSTRLQLDLGKALAGDGMHNLLLQSDDVLIVRGITDWQEATDKFVTLKGEVRFPGIYSLARGERLSSLIVRAGGFTDKAYLRGFKFTRRSVREQQQKRMDEIIIKTEKDILQKQSSLASLSSSKEELEATKSALEGLMQNVVRMKNLRAEGRVVMQLAKLEELKGSNSDLVLEGGDEMEIPLRPNVVSVLGQVYNPTSFIHLEGMNLDRYLQKSGGPVNDADPSEMYVVRMDGSVYSRQQSSFGIQWSDEGRRWSFGSFLSAPMEPGDTLVVPQKLDRVSWIRDLKDITQILANVALTAGTILVGLK
ncbi:MAG: SLBB domain-containing protein [Desulfuromonadales bacterium]